MITHVALIGVGGAVGAVAQAVVVGRFGARWGGAGLVVVCCTLFGALWALSDPNPRVAWRVVDRDTIAPLLFGMVAAAAPLSAVLGADRPFRWGPGTDLMRRMGGALLLAVAALITASAAMMLGYLSIRGGYTLYFRLTRIWG